MSKRRRRVITVDPWCFRLERIGGDHFLVMEGDSTRARIKLDRSYVVEAIARECWKYVNEQRAVVDQQADALRGKTS